MDTPHPVDAAIAEYSDIYSISFEHGIWHARLRPVGGQRWRRRELAAATWGELRGLMLADPARKLRT